MLTLDDWLLSDGFSAMALRWLLSDACSTIGRLFFTWVLIAARLIDFVLLPMVQSYGLIVCSIGSNMLWCPIPYCTNSVEFYCGVPILSNWCVPILSSFVRIVWSFNTIGPIGCTDSVIAAQQQFLAIFGSIAFDSEEPLFERSSNALRTLLSATLLRAPLTNLTNFYKSYESYKFHKLSE